MNINRHNYEEFFLLYVDNELSAAERNAVEVFVEENTDLKEELSLLQETVFKTDAIIFDNKNSLLKEEYSPLQENLLFYIDNELPAAEKLQTEKLLQTDIVAAKEFTLLQQTKLPAEAIVFANKEVLYRKEEGRVVSIPWRRIAAAAILLGVGTWATLTFTRTNKTTDGVDVANSNTPAAKNNTIAVVTPTTQNGSNTVDSTTNTTSTPAIAAVIDQNTTAPVTSTSTPINNSPQTNASRVKQEVNNVSAYTVIKAPSNNLPKPVYENINKPESNKEIVANVSPMKTAIDNNNSGQKIITAALDNKTNPDGVNGYALNTSFKESDNDNELDSEEKGKKSKLGGFFRKVKRMVERNTNVNTGNGIKVAGFDIAIK